jgi:hypothetical protein
MKQETLEEAAENAFNDFKRENPIVPEKHILPYKLGYIEGAKWQAERMYSEEEVRDLFIKYQYDLAQWVLRMEDDINGRPIPIEWFEQFKKK